MADRDLDDLVRRTPGTPRGNWGIMLDKMGQPPVNQGPPGRGYPEIWKVLGIGLFIWWLMWPSDRPEPQTVSPPRRPLPQAPNAAPSLAPTETPPSTLAPPADAGTPPAESGRVAAAPMAPLVPMVLSATHKHRLGDCEGELTLSADAIRFRSDELEDSFVFAIDQVQLDDDGVKDPNGKAWHFKVEGRDMRDTFRRWKAGVLLQNPAD